MSLRHTRAAVVVALTLVAPAARPAAGVTGVAAMSPSTIDVIVVGSAGLFDQLRALLDRRLSALGATVWSRTDRFDPGDVLAPAPVRSLHCWIDLREPRRARLYFAARSGERFLLRDLELSGDLALSGELAEIDRAGLAEVIELSIGALLEDARAGLSRSETKALLTTRAAPEQGTPAVPGFAPPPGGPSSPVDAPAPVRQAPPGAPPRFEFGAFYAAQAVAAGVPLDNGPGLSLAFAEEVGPALHRPRLVSAGWLSLQYLLPETVTGAQAGVGLDAVAARLGLELGLPRWRLRLGAGWNFIHVSPETTNASVALAPSHWTTTLALRGALRVQVGRAAYASFWISLLADLFPTAVDYDVDVGGRLVAVFSPWRVRPGIALEATLP